VPLTGHRGAAARPDDAPRMGARRTDGRPQAKRAGRRPERTPPDASTEPSARPVRCPWCFAPVDLVTCWEVRRRAMLYGQPIVRASNVIADDHPGWWCPDCHAGGVLIMDQK